MEVSISKKEQTVVLCGLGKANTEKKAAKKYNHLPQGEGLDTNVCHSVPAGVAEIKGREMKTSQTSDGCSTFTQRAAFPGDARNTAGIKAIPHSTFSKELIQIFYFVFHQFVT